MLRCACCALVVHGRTTPERWRRPGSARWQDWIAENGVPLTQADILMGLWPQSTFSGAYVRPKWAYDAWKRGWMRLATYLRLPREEWVWVPGLYEDSPSFAMKPRTS